MSGATAMVFRYRSEGRVGEEEEEQDIVEPVRIYRMRLAERMALPLDDLIEYQQRLSLEAREFAVIEWREAAPEAEEKK